MLYPLNDAGGPAAMSRLSMQLDMATTECIRKGKEREEKEIKPSEKERTSYILPLANVSWSIIPGIDCYTSPRSFLIETLFDFVATLDLVDMGNFLLHYQLCCFKVAGEELFFL